MGGNLGGNHSNRQSLEEARIEYIFGRKRPRKNELKIVRSPPMRKRRR